MKTPYIWYNINTYKINKQSHFERVILVTNLNENSRQEDICSIENAMNTLFVKLDKAIDDIENGRVITENEMWEKLGKI